MEIPSFVPHDTSSQLTSGMEEERKRYFYDVRTTF